MAVTPYFLIFLFITLPVAVIGAPLFLLDETWSKLLWLCLAPASLLLSMGLVPAFLSRVAHHSIKPGTFPRDPKHEVYGWRRVYGICWTGMYYFKPLYWAFLSMPGPKHLLFRLYGYKGSTDFTIYPDTWIRDLPLLDFGAKAYLANRATLGSNLCLKDGSIFVDTISVGAKTIIGHLAIFAAGGKTGTGAEIGIGTAIGLKAKIGDNTKFSPTCAVNHGVTVGSDCNIGAHSYLGLRSQIKDGITLPAGSNIPAGAIINTQADVTTFVSSESSALREVLMSVSSIVNRPGATLRHVGNLAQ